MYVVTGATGNTGRATIQALLSRGERVRAVVRTADRGRAIQAPGIEVVVADVADPSALAAVLAGARGVYLLRPPQPRTAGLAVSESFRRAIQQSAVDRIVALSSIGAQHAEGTGVVGGLHDMEETLRQSGREVVFLRAASFFENWHPVMGVARSQGILPSLVPTTLEMATVAAADIGETVGSLLVEGSGGVGTVGLDGPRTYSAEDVARAVGARLGRPIAAVEVPLGVQQGQLEAAGVPPAYAVEVVQLYRGILDGTVAREPGEFVKRGTTTIEEWVAANVPREAA